MKNESISEETDDTFPDELKYRSDEQKTSFMLQVDSKNSRLKIWTGRKVTDDLEELIDYEHAGDIHYMIDESNNISLSIIRFENVEEEYKLTDVEWDFYLQSEMVNNDILDWIELNAIPNKIN